MNRIAVFLLCVLSVNVLLVDVVAYRVDRSLRSQRDLTCDFFRPYHESDTLRISMGGGVNHSELHFYGCDANGHKYRFWEERAK